MFVSIARKLSRHRQTTFTPAVHLCAQLKRKNERCLEWEP